MDRPRPFRLRRTRGFTLIELSVVVTIVAVLSVIALVGYRKYMLNAKTMEAQTMISGIKIAQEERKAEKGAYANVGVTPCPVGAGVSNLKFGWDPTCPGGPVAWNALSVHVEGPVQFAYITQAGVNSTVGKPPDDDFVTWGAGTLANWYTVEAKCDLDPGGLFTVMIGSSVDNRIFSKNVGE